MICFDLKNKIMGLCLRVIKLLLVLVHFIGLSQDVTKGLAQSTIHDGKKIFQNSMSQWIWTKSKNEGPFQFVRFKKEIELDGAIEDAIFFIGGDTFYRLWINGNFVMHGPARSSEGMAIIDPVPVTSQLQRGTNIIEVEAMYYEGRFEALGQAPGIWGALKYSQNGQWHEIGTDATWKNHEIKTWSQNSPKFSFQRTFIEDIDALAGQEIMWKYSLELGEAGVSPWTNMVLRDIPLPDPHRIIYPSNVVSVQKGDGYSGELLGTPELESTRYGPRPEWCKRLQTEGVLNMPSVVDNPSGVLENGRGDVKLFGDGASVVYDLGANSVGFIGFEVSGKEGDTLEIVWNESLDPVENTVRPIQGIEATQALRYVFKNGRQQYIAFNPHLARFIKVVHRGEGDITLHRLWMVDHSFAAPQNGSFECSDQAVNNIYNAAIKTARLSTLDTFMDNPGRERGSWMREGYWMAQCVYYAFSDLDVSRQMVRYGANSQFSSDAAGPNGMVQMLYPAKNITQEFIPAHALYWVLQAGLHKRYSGDLDFVREILPSIRFLMKSFMTWQNGEGLLENVDGWDFIDWTDMRTDGISIALNAIWAKTLDEAAQLENSIGENAKAKYYYKMAKKVRRSINQFCNNEVFYPDVLSPTTNGNYINSQEVSEATQYFVLWADIPSPERKKIMWNVLSNSFQPTPGNDDPIMGLPRGGLYSFFERLQVASGQDDHSALIRDIKTMFQPMAESSPGTLWEHPQRQWSLCQGLSSGVASILTEEILGIKMNDGIRISPHGGGQVSWSKGEVMTSNGPLSVSWKYEEDLYELNIEVPSGMSAEVIFPPEAKIIWGNSKKNQKWPEKLIVTGKKQIRIQPSQIQYIDY